MVNFKLITGFLLFAVCCVLITVVGGCRPAAVEIGNEAPNVDLGDDFDIFTRQTVVLRANVTDDGLPIPPSELTYSWEPISGPAIIPFSHPNSLETSVVFDVPGVYIINFTASDGDKEGSDDLVILVKSRNTQPTNFAPDEWIEAERGNIFGPMKVENGFVFTDTNNAGKVSFTFDIVETNMYFMKAMVLAANTGSDSFFVGLDDEAAMGDNAFTWDLKASSTVVEDVVSLRGSEGNYSWAQHDPMVWNLVPGTYTITFYGRENDAKLDGIKLEVYVPHQETEPNCTDGILNNGEEKTDCGGPNCAACEPDPDYSTEDLYGTRTKYNCDYYASPNGGGNGLLESSPFLISDFWDVNNIQGKVLCLMDGTYKGIDSLIQPPIGLSGTENSPITIVALHDGKVFLDGSGQKSPVFLDGNSWFVLEGFNMFNSSQAKKGDVQASVSRVEDANDVTFRRVVAWHAANGNTGIFSTDYARRIIREDCAGFGQSRTPGGNGHRSDTNSDTIQGKETNNVLRRFWGRTEYNTWAGQKGISVSYNTNGNIVENAIVTMDGYLTKQDSEGIGSSDHFGFHEDRGTDKNNKILGSIFYQTADQKIEGSDMNTILNIRGENDEIKDFLSVIEREEPTSGDIIKTGARLNGENFANFEATHMTFIGGPGLNVAHGSNDLGNIIVQNIDFNIGADAKNADINPGIAIWTTNVPLGGTPDYVMAWNNYNNWNSEPEHNSVEDPDLIGEFGNVLQYGTADRPMVDGQPVGAQIACRYEDGELTNEPLWPWPMEERIRVATCMYDEGKSLEYCEQHSELGVKVTKTVFELEGGSVPDFEALNPIVCPGN